MTGALKKRVTAYNLWASEHRAAASEELKNASPDKAFPQLGEVQKALGKKWADLAPEVKAKYEETAAKERERILAAERQPQSTDRLEELRARRSELSGPRPEESPQAAAAAACELFLQAQGSAAEEEAVAARLREQWAALPEEQRRLWEERRAAREAEARAERLRAWEASPEAQELRRLEEEHQSALATAAAAPVASMVVTETPAKSSGRGRGRGRGAGTKAAAAAAPVASVVDTGTPARSGGRCRGRGRGRGRGAGTKAPVAPYETAPVPSPPAPPAAKPAAAPPQPPQPAPAAGPPAVPAATAASAVPGVAPEAAPACNTTPSKKRPLEVAAAGGEAGDACSSSVKSRPRETPQEPSGDLGLDEETLKRARRAGLQGALFNLAERSEIKALSIPGPKLMAALKKCGGLVNAAKHALLSDGLSDVVTL